MWSGESEHDAADFVAAHPGISVHGVQLSGVVAATGAALSGLAQRRVPARVPGVSPLKSRSL